MTGLQYIYYVNLRRKFEGRADIKNTSGREEESDGPVRIRLLNIWEAVRQVLKSGDWGHFRYHIYLPESKRR